MSIGVVGRKIPEAARSGPLVSLEHARSFDMAPRNASFVPRNMLIEIFASEWLASHPDRMLEENAAVLEMVEAYRARIASGAVPAWDDYVDASFGYDDAVATIRTSTAHLRTACAELNLPLEPAP